MSDSVLAVGEPAADELEALFVNNADLEKLKAYSNRFNPIRVMRAADKELRHSAILGWLFSPTETHGLGDHFLKAFLGEALRGMTTMKPSALDVAQAELRDAEVRLEWRNIDILVLCPRNRWAFVIENKFHSQQHDGQLTTYKERAYETLNAATGGTGEGSESIVRGIFLTLHDEEPQDADYATIQYKTISGLLRRFLEPGAYAMVPEVRTFLSHYLEILEEESGMSAQRTEMEILARKLYRDHKKVIDFVIEHGAGSDFALAARAIVGDNPKPLSEIVEVAGLPLLFSGLSNSQVSFVPKSWLEPLRASAKAWPGCENWWAGLPVILWLEIATERDGIKGKVKLSAEVGPLSPSRDRARLIEHIKALNLPNIQFQSGAADAGRRYSRFFKKNTISVDDVHDSEEIERKIRALIDRFRDEIIAVSGALAAFVSEEKELQA